MEAPLLVLIGVTLAALAFWYWLWHKAHDADISGDGWYMRRMAFTDESVSPPYCWRPLLPFLARYVGFGPVSLAACALTPLAIYGYAGGDWVGTALGLGYIGNKTLFSFNVKNTNYAEGLGHLLFVLALWALSAGSLWAWPLFVLAVLCRESIGAALGIIALFWNPWLLIALAFGGAVAYFGKARVGDEPPSARGIKQLRDARKMGKGEA